MYILVLAIIVVVLVVLYFLYGTKLKAKGKIIAVRMMAKKFFSECDNMQSDFVSEDNEKQFVEKWRSLYVQAEELHISEKNESFLEIERFKSAFLSLHETFSASNDRYIEELNKRISVFREPMNRFFCECNDLRERYVTEQEKKPFIEKWQSLYLQVRDLRIPEVHESFAEFERFKNDYESLPNFFETANDNFIKKESAMYDYLFSNIDGKSLDAQQRAAVITDENRVLVLAGAGSGKTLTIAAKVKYLCEVRKVSPKDILLISFTRKSAQEMTERICNKLGIMAEATTFHKLGLDIIKNAEGRCPDISDEGVLNRFVHNFFEKELLNYPDLIKNLTEYFTYFLEIPDKVEDFSSLGEYYEAEKNADLETLKSKYDREKFVQEKSSENAKKYTTLNNEKVKSLEETKIANFLFMHGVNYEYEIGRAHV